MEFPDLQVMLNPVMTKSEEFEVAQELVAALLNFNKLKGLEDLNALDRFAVAKHLENVAKFVKEALSQDALALTKTLIDKHIKDDNGEVITMGKEFFYKGNYWNYVITEEYTQLGEQFLPDGNRDPNSISYHSCEMAQLKLKEESKAITKQMEGLRARILNDHPRLLPTNITVSLRLKEVK